MQDLTAYLATVSLGAMMFFSFVFAPLVFTKLPAQQAGQLIRAVFPWYYSVLGAVTGIAAAAGFYSGANGSLIMLAVAAGFAVSLFVLMPAINAARDRDLGGDAKAGKLFQTLHMISVVLNLAQIIRLARLSLALLI